jgi:hypothetical protein
MFLSRQVLSGGKGLGGAFNDCNFGEHTKPLVWDIFAVGPEADWDVWERKGVWSAGRVGLCLEVRL